MMLVNKEYIFYLLTLLTTVTLAVPLPEQDTDVPTCGYSGCPATKDGMINVHFIPHSHDDVGWLKTVDQYYYGDRSDIQRAGVQYILDSVTIELLTDPNKRFVQVETAFFWKWWLEQEEDMREKFTSLVNSGQIEMIGGGWSMSDEGATHYQSVIDQYTLGLRRLNDTFGECGRPRVGWQIDTFGHSRESASIMAQMGFDGLFFARVDEEDRAKRLGDKTMEMIWHASANLGSAADLFTSIFFIHYSAPGGLCFDILCGDVDPIVDDPDNIEYNVAARYEAFRQYIDVLADRFSGTNVLVPLGDDFNYQDAHMYYKNIDKLISYANAQQENGGNLNLFYSTPSCYLQALNSENKIWSTKTDDFFPYATDSKTFWTGFYTSRPSLKRFERYGNNLLQVCKQLSVLANLTDDDNVNKVNKLREAMGVVQHHDAITGTETQDVANDYSRQLAAGIDACDQVSNDAIGKLLTENNQNAVSVQTSSCHFLNISQCDTSENSDTFLVAVYNPLSRPVSPYVRLPVTGDSYEVTDAQGNGVPSQLVPVLSSVVAIPERSSKAANELVFRAENLPGLGYALYQVTASENSNTMKMSEESDDNQIGNDVLTVKFDSTTGLMKSITNNGIEIPLEQNYYYYVSAQDNAYIFTPDGTDPIEISNQASVNVYKGDLVEEVHQVFSDWVSQVIRVYKGVNHVELQWMVGPIPIDDDKGKEVITRFTTDLDTQELFYTDSNGREIIERKRNYRPTWDINLEEVVSGNYYPVTSKILIRDESKGVEVAVLNDRAQGGSSLADGQMEVMVHRRLLTEDFISLNETQFGHGLIVTGHHYLVAGSVDGDSNFTSAAQERLLAQEVLLKPWIFLSSDAVNMDDIQNEFSGLKNGLTPNVQVLTLENVDNSLLLRLEHILEKNEDPSLSQDVTVNLQDLLSTVTITSVKETTLAGNQWLSDSKRMEWSTTDSEKIPANIHDDEDDFNVTLSPMEIRTFIVTTA